MNSQAIPSELMPFLESTSFIDSDHPEIVSFTRNLVGSCGTDVERAIRIFYSVRDDISYTPYGLVYTPERMTASYTLAAGRGFCVQKALLLAATARCAGIPSRLAFADVRNHLVTTRLLKLLGSNVFIYHGYTELWIDGSWLKATPTFNASLCEKFGVRPLEFDGIHDSVLQPFDRSGNRYMEYVRSHGSFRDLPFALLEAEYAAAYPDLFLSSQDSLMSSDGDFEREAGVEGLVRG